MVLEVEEEGVAEPPRLAEGLFCWVYLWGGGMLGVRRIGGGSWWLVVGGWGGVGWEGDKKG